MTEQEKNTLFIEIEKLIHAYCGKTEENENLYYRGDIWLVRKTGAEEDLKEYRPAVIVSNDKGNRHSSYVTIVPLTTQDKPPLPTHASVQSKMPSTALCESVRTVRKELLLSRVGRCSDEEIENINAALRCALGL